MYYRAVRSLVVGECNLVSATGNWNRFFGVCRTEFRCRAVNTMRRYSKKMFLGIWNVDIECPLAAKGATFMHPIKVVVINDQLARCSFQAHY